MRSSRAAAVAAVIAVVVYAGTSTAKPARTDVVAGRDLPLRSTGSPQRGAWALDANGYAGGYVRVDRPGAVTVTVTASGVADEAPARMAVAIADTTRAFDVGPRPASHAATTDLPAGTYFLRVDYLNHARRASRELWIHEVAIAGARFIAEATDAVALDAADTYVRAFRKGAARVTVPGTPPGTTAHVRLRRHAFNFGVNIPFATNRMIPAEAPAAGSDAERYQRMVREHFNTVVLSNGGKWLFQEEKRGQVSMAYVDRFLAFAAASGLRARMHNMLWDTEQQPAWVVSDDPRDAGLLTHAKNGDARAKAELTAAIDARINYYVRERAARYEELDVVNESVHRARYWQIYGAQGFAELFNKTAEAVKAAGAHTRLFLNEYNLLQSSIDPLGGGPDPYANWYRRHADEIRRAGGAVDGLGVQYYVDGRTADQIGSNAHSPARMTAALQNLAGTGLRLSLTEFSVNAGHPERAADIVEETMRIVFGTPQADSFLIWAIWPRAAQPPAPSSILFDDDGALTPSGRRYETLMQRWTTDLTLPVAPDGTVDISGFYGDYELTAGPTVSCFSLAKGVSRTVAAPCANVTNL